MAVEAAGTGSQARPHPGRPLAGREAAGSLSTQQEEQQSSEKAQ